jgi:predicted DNA-binding protein with PD1-like motif
MTGSPRRLAQPGPADPERIVSVEGRGRPIEIVLEAGLSLNEAVARPLLAAGAEGASVEIEGGGFEPFAYVLPGFSVDPRYAAYYSETFAPPGRTRLEAACLTFGQRDGEPFLHCHAVWLEPDGTRRGGHILPHEAVVAEPIRGRAYLSPAIAWRAEPDPETNFTLFQPVAGTGAVLPAGPRLVAARIRPNEDFAEAVEALCERHGLRQAAIRGSLGSLIDPLLEGHARLDSVSTELLIRRGTVRTDASGRPRAEIEVALVDTGGKLHEGRLTPGNPVCITFELLLEELPD